MGRIKFKNNLESNDNLILNQKLETEKIKTIASKNIFEENQNIGIPEILYEDASNREENIKHFKMSDGTYQAQIFNESIQHFNDKEKDKSIDNSFNESDKCQEDEDDFEGYQNKQGNLKVKFNKYSNENNLFFVEKGEHKLIWKLLGKKEKERKNLSINSIKAIIPTNKKSDIETDVINNKNNEIRYNDFVRDTDLQFIVTSNKIKENIVVKEKQDTYEYQFELKLKNLDVELSDDQQNLNFYNNKTNAKTKEITKDIIFTIPMPYMYDAKGEKSNDVTYELELQNNGNYIFNVIADKNWINAEERVFPVVIDPSIITFNPILQFKMSKLHYNAGFCAEKEKSYTYFRVNGEDFKAFLNGKKIVSATLKIKIDVLISSFDDHRFMLFKNKGTWENPITDYENTYACLPKELLEKQIIELDITQYILDKQNWDKGFILDTFNNADESERCYIMFFDKTYYTLDENLITNAPMLSVTYLDKKEINSEKNEFSVLGAGTGIIDLFSGNLNFLHQDINLKGNRQAINISHVYNGNYANEIFDNNMNVGKGWKLNIQQKIKIIDLPTSIYNSSFISNKEYIINQEKKMIIYVDAMGVEHTFAPRYYFLKTVNNDSEMPDKQIKQYIPKYYYDSSKNHIEEFTDGKGLYLKIDNYNYTITDENKNSLIFDKTTGNLTQIKGKKVDTGILIHYYSNNRITVVQDFEMDRLVEFEYFSNSNNLKSINCSDGNYISYEYDDNGYLNKINYGQNGDYSSFNYKSNGLLEKITGPSGHSQYLTYDDESRVDTLKEQSKISKMSYDEDTNTVNQEENNELIRRYLQFFYNSTHTSIRNDLNTTYGYIFNNAGNIKTIYEKNGSSQEIIPKPNEIINYSYNIKYNYFDVINSYNYNTGNGNDIYKSSVILIPENANNLIINPELKIISNNLSGWTSSCSINPLSSTDYEGGIIVHNNAKKICSIGQSIDVSKINKTNYVLGGWAKSFYSAAIGNDYESYTYSPKFMLQALIIYRDGMYKYFNAPFDASQKDWQFTAVPIFIDKTKELDSLEIRLVYDYNNNSVAFGSVGLYEQDVAMTTIYANNFSETTDQQKTIHQSMNSENKLCNVMIIDHLDGDKKYRSLYTYDSEDRIKTENKYNGVTVNYDYFDSENQIIKTTNGTNVESIVEQYYYNNNDYLNKYVNAVTKMEYEHDNYGNIMKIKIPNHNGINYYVPPAEINYNYDDYNELLKKMSVAIPDDNKEGLYSTEYVYRKKGLLFALKHNNFMYNFEYDGFGRIIKILINNQPLVEYTYHRQKIIFEGLEAIERINSKFANGYTFIDYFDIEGNCLKRSVLRPGETTEEDIFITEYDKQQKILTEKDKNASKIYKTWYNDDKQIFQMSEYNSSNNQEVKRTYNYFDSKKRLKTRSYVISGERKSFDIEYDETGGLNNRISKITNSNNSYGQNIYDAYGRVKEYKFPSGSRKYTYQDGRLYNYNQSGIRGENLNFSYDNSGNIDSIYGTRFGIIQTAPIEVNTDWAYDSVNRLIHERCDDFIGCYTVSGPGGGTFAAYNRYQREYNYDDGGNLSEKKEYDYNLTDGKGALRKTINYTYYDGWKDRLKSYNGSQDIPYDVNGNPLKWFKHGTNGSTLERDLVWDSNNRLVKVTKGTNVIEYKYNSAGQRIQKNTGGMTFDYYYDNDMLIMEHRKSSSYNYKFIYSYDINGICHFEVKGHPALDGSYSLIKNEFGDVVQVGCLNPEVDYAYDAWGKPMVTCRSNAYFQIFDCPFRYRGYYYDEDTGLYYLNSRYYDPEVGRFISPDDISYLDPESINGCNLYAYCLNNPVMNIDPSGHFVFTTMLISAIVFGAVTGGFIAGKTAYGNGLGIGEILLSGLGGALLGGAFGAAFVLGGAAALGASAVAGFSMSTGVALAVSVGISAAAGFAKYGLERAAYGEKFNWGDAGIFSLKASLQGAATFGAGYFGGKFGLFDKMINGDGITGIYAKLTTHGSTANIIRQTFMVSEYLVGETITKTMFITPLAIVNRKLINFIFNKL